MCVVRSQRLGASRRICSCRLAINLPYYYYCVALRWQRTSPSPTPTCSFAHANARAAIASSGAVGPHMPPTAPAVDRTTLSIHRRCVRKAAPPVLNSAELDLAQSLSANFPVSRPAWRLISSLRPNLSVEFFSRQIGAQFSSANSVPETCAIRTVRAVN